MKIALDDRFTIKMTGTPLGWKWSVYDEVDQFEYIDPQPAKDQTTVLLLAAEIIRERY